MSISVKEHLIQEKLDLFLIKYSDENQLDLLDFSKIQCDHINKFCDPISVKNKKIYYDRGHLTLDGIDFFQKKSAKNLIIKLFFVQFSSIHRMLLHFYSEEIYKYYRDLF